MENQKLYQKKQLEKNLIKGPPIKKTIMSEVIKAKPVLNLSLIHI